MYYLCYSCYLVVGTGNGMAKSLLDAAGEVYSVSNATFSIIRGPLFLHNFILFIHMFMF